MLEVSHKGHCAQISRKGAGYTLLFRKWALLMLEVLEEPLNGRHSTHILSLRNQLKLHSSIIASLTHQDDVFIHQLSIGIDKLNIAVHYLNALVLLSSTQERTNQKIQFFRIPYVAINSQREVYLRYRFIILLIK